MQGEIVQLFLFCGFMLFTPKGGYGKDDRGPGTVPYTYTWAQSSYFPSIVHRKGGNRVKQSRSPKSVAHRISIRRQERVAATNVDSGVRVLGFKS